jgi:IS30 family transposase
MNITKDEVKQLDALFSPLLRKRQSIHHICVNHRDSIMVSESTIYRLVDSNLFEARNIDMPRKVRFAPRKKKKPFKVDKTCRIGRTYDDYKMFIQNNPDTTITQIDTVEGKKGCKVLLTIHLVKSECMLAFIRDKNDSQSVIDTFERLYLELMPDNFCTLFPLLLGDNGSEFSNPKALEFDEQGNRRSHVFYCDSLASWQKGSCERNHSFIRMFLPKGVSMKAYTQNDIQRMVDHINSYKRPSLGDKSPYEMLTYMYGDKILSLLNCRPIAPDDVTLSPAIFRKAGTDYA